GSIILDPLAWRILVPVLVSITGGIITQAIKDKLAAKKNSAEAEREAKSFTGRLKKRVEAGEYQECVSTVETILLPFGIRKERTQVIVRRLTQAQSEEPTAEKTDL